MTTPPPRKRELLLFVYDSLMSGLPQSPRLATATLLGPAATEPHYHLVDLGPSVALVPGGTTSVRGELYSLDVTLLASLDIEKGHPVLHKRALIRLEDGREAQAYTLSPDQARARRRIHSGDYRAHTAPLEPASRTGAWSRWAKTRGRSAG